MKYLGVIVKESLSDIAVLDRFEVLSTQTIGPENDTWNLVKVIGSKKQVTELKDFIKEGPWYANFWSEKGMLVVFKDKVVTDKVEAIKYGLSINIPNEQLDFKQD